MYKVLFDKSAFRQFKKLPIEVYGRIFNAIIELAHQPNEAQATKLTNIEAYRIRIGDYRVIYTLKHKEKIIFITAISHRRDVYQ